MKIEDIEIKIKVDTTELDGALKKIDKLKAYTGLECSVSSGIKYSKDIEKTIRESVDKITSKLHEESREEFANAYCQHIKNFC